MLLLELFSRSHSAYNTDTNQLAYKISLQAQLQSYRHNSLNIHLLKEVQAYAAAREEALPVHFDIVKLPHHGSARNISEDWPQVLRGDRYILCADGRRHPSKQTAAKLLRWYGTAEIVSPWAWWNSGYFSVEEEEQFIHSNRLRLIVGK